MGRPRPRLGGRARARGLARVTETPDTPRDVFLYVISGHKVANPAAAEALLARLR